MEVWPNLFIVGAPRAGTTSLYQYLKKIPGIYMSPIKEPGYLISEVFSESHPNKPIMSKEKYLRLFEKVKAEKIIGEGSTLYLADPESPNLIHNKVPNAKIIISLRDPVERAFSSYLMLKQIGWINTPTFEEEITRMLNSSIDFNKPYLRLNEGNYSDQVKRYLNMFGKDQIKIIIFEEFIENPKKTVEDIVSFLGLKNALANFNPEIYNKSRRISETRLSFRFKNKQIFTPSLIQFLLKKILKKLGISNTKEILYMTDEDKKKLIRYYEDDVNKLQRLLKRELPWKNFPKNNLN